MTTQTFIPGQSYCNNSGLIGSFSIFHFTVLSRTQKSLTIQEPGRKPRRVKVHTHDGVEFVTNTNGVRRSCTWSDNR